MALDIATRGVEIKEYVSCVRMGGVSLRCVASSNIPHFEVDSHGIIGSISVGHWITNSKDGQRSLKSWLTRSAQWGAALVCLAFGNERAAAEFKVCNQSIALYNVAIGAEFNGKFHTEGWWSVPANACVNPIKEDLAALKLKYVYVYATTVTGQAAFDGDWEMCVDTRRFKIERIPDQPWNCWVRGYQLVKFKEIDTGESGSWTVFVRDGEG